MESRRAKVTFPTNETDWHRHSSETLWAELDDGKYTIANIPFFAKGISLDDTVLATESPAGTLDFAGVASRGGHSTCRILSTRAPEDARFKELLGTLARLGCEYESGQIQDVHVLAVDIPSGTSPDDAIEVLELGRSEGVWDWEVGHDGHPDFGVSSR